MRQLNSAVSLLIQILLISCFFWIFTSGAFVINREFFNFLSSHQSLHLLSLKSCALLILSLALWQYYNAPDQLSKLEPFRSIHTFYKLSPKASLTFLFLTYAITHGLILCFMHAGLGTTLWDTGFNDQIIWNTAHGNFLINSIRGGQNVLGEHFFLFQAVLSLIYRFTDRIEVLFFFQTTAIAASIPLIYMITKKITGNHSWPLTLAIALFLYEPLRNGILFPFHSETFADPFLLLGFLLALNGKWFYSVLSLLIAMTCKENIAMEVFGIGLFFAVYKRQKAGWGICALSLVTLFAVMKIIEPYFSFGYSWNKWGYYSHFTHPTAEGWAAVFQSLFSLNTIKFLGLILAPVLFLPLAGFAWFWLMGPTLAIRLFTAFPGFKIIAAHYTVGLNAVLFAAAAVGVYTVIVKFPSKSKALQISVLGASLFFAGIPGLFILENQMWEASFAGNQRVIRVLESIPRQHSVIASENFLPHVAHRPHVFSFGNVQEGSPLEEIEKNAQIIIIDLMRKSPDEMMELTKRIQQGYFLILKTDEMEVYLHPNQKTGELMRLASSWDAHSKPQTNYRKTARKIYRAILLLLSLFILGVLIKRSLFCHGKQSKTA